MKKKFSFVAILFALLMVTANVAAQTNPIKIITQHPDLSVKVKRCAASGNIVIIDLTVTNLSTNDIEIRLCSGWSRSTAYDDEGNIYNGNNLMGKVANQTEYGYHDFCNRKLISNVPTKVSIRITGVPTSAQMIALLELETYCRAFGLDGKMIQIRNVPISRD